MLSIVVAIVVSLFGNIESAPDEGKIPPLISFDKGKIGVNFFGFRAAAGLGSILTGNAADGGLYAEAGTPFGQFAHAGVGGQADGQGRSAGGLFAGATAGNGISAKAGLGGAAGEQGSTGSLYAGASAGGVTQTRVKTIGAPLEGAVIVSKEVNGKEKQKFVQVIPHKGEGKTLDKITDKEDNLDLDIDVRTGEVMLPPPEPPIFNPEPPIIIEKTKIKGRRRPHLKRKQILISRGGYYNGLDALPGPPIAPFPETYPAVGPIPGEVPYGPVGVNGIKTVSIRKAVNPQLINDIFNIPISTLTAVSQLVGGIAKGVDGKFEINKSVSVNTDISKQ